MASIVAFLSDFWHIILTILGFSFIIFVHELGHFIMAKRAGVKVDKFYIGFDFGGIKIFSMIRNGTEYGIGVFPFGGYVKLHGYEELPGHERQTTDTPKEHFHSKTIGERLGIMAGGVAMNFISAVILILVMYGIGKEYQAPIVGNIYDVATVQGGLKVDDTILEINGEPVKTFIDVRKKVILSQSGALIRIKVLRGGEEKEISFVPSTNYEQGIPELGIIPQRGLKIGALYDGSPAEKAGIKPGDLLETVNGEKLANADQFDEIIKNNAGQTLHVGLVREGVSHSIDLTPSGQPSYLKKFKSGLANSAGLMIETVNPDSAAASAGLKAMDKLISVDDLPVFRVEDISRILNETKGKEVRIKINRDGEILEIPVAPAYNLAEHRYLLGVTTSDEGTLGEIGNIEINGPAYLGGLRIGDKILAIQNQKITSSQHLRRLLHPYFGQTVKVQYERVEGEQKNLYEGDVHLRKPTRVGPFTKMYHKMQTLFSGNAYLLDAYGMGVAFKKEFYLAKPEEGSPAAIAGFQEGDRFINVQYELPGKSQSKIITKDKNSLPSGWNHIDALYASVASQLSIVNGKVVNADVKPEQLVLKITYERNNVELQTILTPAETSANAAGYSGLLFNHEMVLYRYSSIGEAVKLVYTESLGMLEFTVSSFAKLVSGDFTTEALAGPFGIIPLMHQVAKSGIVEMLWLVAMLSVNIGFLNLLPFPPLDGGALFFLIIEKIKGSPVSAKIQIIFANIGVVCLLGLMIFVTMNDISRYF